MIETYKILTGELNVDPGHFFKLCTNVTRGRHLKLKKKTVFPECKSKGILQQGCLQMEQAP